MLVKKKNVGIIFFLYISAKKNPPKTKTETMKVFAFVQNCMITFRKVSFCGGMNRYVFILRHNSSSAHVYLVFASMLVVKLCSY